MRNLLNFFAQIDGYRRNVEQAAFFGIRNFNLRLNLFCHFSAINT